MTYDCSCDYGDTPVFCSVAQPRARKSYHCDECGGPILPGEKYERVSALWYRGDDIDTIITCERCYDLRMWVKNNVPCLCIMHGNMDEEMSSAIDDAYDRACEEVVGLKFGFLRRKLMRDRHNQLSRAA